MRYNEVLGSYTPSAFFIELNTDADLLNWSNINYSMHSTLAHEYIHFLQDITSCYGLMNIIQFVDELKANIRTITKQKISRFQIPIQLLDYLFVENNRSMIKIYEGTGRLWDSSRNEEAELNRITGFHINSDQFVNKLRIEFLEVEYINEISGKGKFNMGAACIIESMTANLQEFLFSPVNSPQFPYRTVELFLTKFFPNFPLGKEILIALCDVSLDSYNPGIQFISLLNLMKEQNFVPKDHNDIYGFCEPLRFPIENEDLDRYNFFNNRSNNALSQLKDQFNSEHDVLLINWCENLILSGQKIKSENWVKKLLDSQNSDDKSSNFKNIIAITGLPLISNNQGNYYNSDTLGKIGNNASIIRAINEIHEVLEGSTICTMYNFCELSTPDLVDCRCTTAPWKKISDNILCPFGQLWHKWELDDYSPKIDAQ
ncbi:MAG: hypothetical protein P4L45_05170 [Ignavibacteriaceae bacterium]|nr:hypothetical protein [Ignavibacteriaceae bacterium]